MATGVDAKLLKSTKFPPEFSQKVDMQKVNLQVMKKWIAGKISEILGGEDDVVTELCSNLIEGSRFPDIKSLQIQLTGFLDKDTAPFCKELWKLCLSAQTSPQGVPKELLEAKKLELIQEKIEADKAAEEARKRREEQDRRDRELTEIRDRERRDRGGRGRGDTWRGRRGDRDQDRSAGGPGRGWNRSRSPPRYRDQRDRGSFPGGPRDTYVPRDRRGGRDEHRKRSPARSSPADSATSGPASRNPSAGRSRPSSRSASPPPRRRSPRTWSPSRRRDIRKRSLSPDRDEDYRSRRDNRQGRSARPARRQESRSASPERRSPAPKRRRYLPSRSRSDERHRRQTRSVASRSSGSSRSRSSTPQRRPTRKTADRDSRSRSPSSSSDDNQWRRKSQSRSSSRSDRRKSRRRRDSPRRQKRNTSSDSSLSRRGQPADEFEDDTIKRRAEPRDEETSAKTPQQRANELKEMILREKIKKMRSLKSGSTSNG